MGQPLSAISPTATLHAMPKIILRNLGRVRILTAPGKGVNGAALQQDRLDRQQARTAESRNAMDADYAIRDGLFVSARIEGGLGNQMFQYAAARALAKRLRAHVVLDCTLPQPRQRRFVLDRYPICATVTRNGPLKVPTHHFRLRGTLGRRITDDFHRLVPRYVSVDGKRFKVFEEQAWFAFDPRFETLAGSTYLIGWWQSYRYFESIADAVRSEFRSPVTPSASNQRWRERIRQTNSVCLHVRRGDYLEPAAFELFGICQPAYYANAIHQMRERVDNPVFFVFSDDLTWCRENLAANDVVFVDANPCEEAVDELHLMAACRHQIIANSSFSWWAAWLAQHPTQVVIAPYPWFTRKPAPDLLPERWIRLAPG
jgi:hypothetical protein